MESVVHGYIALTFGALAGVVLFAMVGRWFAALGSAIRSYRTSNASERPSAAWGVIVSASLHSGPWALVVASYLSYYVLSQPHAAWWYWFFAGACAGPVLIGAIALMAVRRARRRTTQPHEPYKPLTGRVLDQERARTVRTITLLYGGAMTLAMMFILPDHLGLVLMMFPLFMGGGYVFSLFMWEWKKSMLQAKDYQRRKAQGGS